MKASVISRVVVFEGDEYVVAGCLALGGFRFWVERPRGFVYLYINEPIQKGSPGLDPFCEILALTWEAQPLKRLALSSGWFEPTSRTLTHPVNQVNEVWRLSLACLHMLAQPDGNVERVKSRVTHTRTQSGREIDMRLGEMMTRLKPSGFASMFVVRPDPAQGSGLVTRSMAAASSDQLWSRHEVLEAGFGQPGAVVFSVDLTLEAGPWSAVLADAGYRAAHVVRIPVVGEEFCEFVALSLTRLGDASMQALALDVLSRWSQWRQAIQSSFCLLTQKERQALKAVSRGLNGSEAAEWLGISERTYRMHIDNAKKKLVAASAAEAAHNAQLLCAF